MVVGEVNRKKKGRKGSGEKTSESIQPIRTDPGPLNRPGKTGHHELDSPFPC
jgi:hypothetical protein